MEEQVEVDEEDAMAADDFDRHDLELESDDLTFNTEPWEERVESQSISYHGINPENFEEEVEFGVVLAFLDRNSMQRAPNSAAVSGLPTLVD